MNLLERPGRRWSSKTKKVEEVATVRAPSGPGLS